MSIKKSQFTPPIIINKDGSSRPLSRVQLSGGVADYNELWLRDLLFENPGCLPVAEIDRAYLPLIPLCKELNVPSVGRVDAVYITPDGRLVILETKLWRNPESRRKVIGQILDYAQAIKKWDYADLQRQVSQATGKKGNFLYQLISSFEGAAGLDEASFIDAVSQNMQEGRFLLLIAGDGIKSQAHSIAEFIMNTGTMSFSLALVEVAIYEGGDAGQRYVQPRILAKTSIIERIVAVAKYSSVDDIEEDMKSDFEYSYSECQKFWQELLNGLELDDPEQVLPKAPHTHNMKFIFPWTKDAWITAYIAGKGDTVGVMFRARKDLAQDVYENKITIQKELGEDVKWRQDVNGLSVVTSVEIDVFESLSRSEAKEYLEVKINHFVNVFRPIIQRLSQ